MAIVGGFGTTFDLDTGISRSWVMDRDGVKRWADSGAPVLEHCNHCGGFGEVTGEYPGVACQGCGGSGKAPPDAGDKPASEARSA